MMPIERNSINKPETTTLVHIPGDVNSQLLNAELQTYQVNNCLPRSKEFVFVVEL